MLLLLIYLCGSSPLYFLSLTWRLQANFDTKTEEEDD
jgi:hypothetical protein